MHAERDREEAKIWLEPVKVAWNHGYSGKELRKVTRIVANTHSKLMRAWHEHCGNHEPR